MLIFMSRKFPSLFTKKQTKKVIILIKNNL